MTEITDSKTLEGLVRKVLAEILAGQSRCCCAEGDRHVDKSGIISIKLPRIKPEPFDTGKPGDKVFLTDLVSLEESKRLGFGIMEMDHSSFDWTLNYDEVDYVIEGRLEIIKDGQKITAEKGEVIFIPKGTSITFSTPDFTRFLYVVYPADWANQ
ncbi:MAG: cupin domain-containing protein [Treponema sp.]|jgi:ethanolamine utilization protein EutQ|nr:cupin domain-containing protein [Treponema sp.]